MYMNDVKGFEVCGFKDEMYFSNSVTSLVYRQDMILVKKSPAEVTLKVLCS